MAQPKFIFKNPWAHQRLDTDAPYPPEVQVNPGSGRTSIALGFPYETMIPQSNGGIPPYGQDFNGILKAITENLTWYSAGGLFEYDNTRSYDTPAIVSYNGKIYRCLKANTAIAPIAPGSNSSYWQHLLDEADIQPIFSDFSGMVSFFATAKSPSANWLVCNGQAVSRTIYAGLFKLIGTTYGAGNGSTTFNLPNLIDRVAWGATSGVGATVEAGLPNITGTFAATIEDQYFPTPTGAFFAKGTAYEAEGRGHVNSNWLLNIDASRSSPVYGRSSTVQPPAVKLLPCIHV